MSGDEPLRPEAVPKAGDLGPLGGHPPPAPSSRDRADLLLALVDRLQALPRVVGHAASPRSVQSGPDSHTGTGAGAAPRAGPAGTWAPAPPRERGRGAGWGVLVGGGTWVQVGRPRKAGSRPALLRRPAGTRAWPRGWAQPDCPSVTWKLEDVDDLVNGHLTNRLGQVDGCEQREYAHTNF